ncbi:MAG: hypothetical protein E7328_03720 [Clostridiales bacterium]|nr:hypothetical protein [Clostridiales bacterium]
MKNHRILGLRRLWLCTLVLFLVLIFSCAAIQLFSHEEYLALAQNTLSRVVLIRGSRGRIFARGGETLAENTPTYTIHLYAYDHSSDAINQSVLHTLNILSCYEDVAYPCTLPLMQVDGTVQYTDGEITEFRTAHDLPPGADASAALSALITRHGLTGLPITEARQCLQTMIGAGKGSKAYTGLNDAALSPLITLGQSYDLTMNIQTGSVTFSPELASWPKERLHSFTDACTQAVGSPPYEGSLPITGGDVPQWHTKEIAKLKTALSLADSATAEDVFTALLTRYDAQPYAQDAHILKLLAVRHSASGNYYKQYHPLPMAHTDDYRTLATIEENILSLPGIAITQGEKRSYPMGNLLSQVLGYTGRMTEEIKSELDLKNYRPDDTVGRDGLERILEDVLHPICGSETIMVDHLGRNKRTLSRTAPKDGADVTLTIRLPMQQAAHNALTTTIEELGHNGHPKAAVGAAVALDVHTGEILCMVSAPGYDPNVFSSPISESTWAQLSPTYLKPSGAVDADPTLPRPLINVATASVFPPGSVYKPFVAAALLENGIVTPRTAIYDHGRYTGFSMRDAPACWIYNTSGRTHGYETVSDALAHSCNYYFYDAGARLGSDAIADYAKRFGFGSETGAQVLWEADGIIGGKAYTDGYLTNILTQKLTALGVNEADAKNKAAAMVAVPDYAAIKHTLSGCNLSEDAVLSLYNYVNDHRFRESQVLSLAIGQGENSFSVLQVANATAALSKKGERYAPTLIHSMDGVTTKPKQLSPAFLSQSTYDAIVKGMVAVVRPGGTAAGAFQDLGVTVAAKTGTAEADGKDDYGWFIAFAPADDPQIALAVMVAQAGGSNACIPTAEAILKAYFAEPN